MNVEQTAEQKLRAQTITCMACGASVSIGANYPPGVPVPTAMELWCPSCQTINLHYRPK